MYHRGTSLKVRQHVLSSLKDPQGSVQIVNATSALGMGVNFRGLHQVLNYGPPNDDESYAHLVEQVGMGQIQRHYFYQRPIVPKLQTAGAKLQS